MSGSAALSLWVSEDELDESLHADSAPGSSCRGKVAELDAASLLLSLGHKIAVPLVDDDAVDLIVDYRTTVQVKSSAAVIVRAGTHQYRFHMFKSVKCRWTADFFLLHGQGDPVTWWVVPGEVLRARGVKQSVSVYPGKTTGWSAYLEPYIGRWELLRG